MFLAPGSRDPERREGRNHRAFERRDERHDLTKARQLANRVDDELPRSVVGDVAAALDLDDVDAARSQERAALLGRFHPSPGARA
jgi:hypothetical protein